jgi:hypothetical protein
MLCGGVQVYEPFDGETTGSGPDACPGDGGGPLVIGNPGGFRVIGLASWGHPWCGNAPTVYTRASHYLSWIQGEIGAPSSTVGTFRPVEPFRLVDTRTNVGKLGSGYVGPQWTITPQVIGMGTGPNQVPIDEDVNAVVVNVAVTSPSAAGWLTLHPTGSALPTAANLNFVAGQTVGNLATVQLGQGKFSVANTVGGGGAGFVHIIIDVVGYYESDAAGALFHELAPTRVLDTRFGTPDNPGANNPILQNAPRAVTVCGGTTGLPTTASAIVANISVVAGSTHGWLTAWPEGAAPTVANLNYTPGQAIANLGTVKVNLPECTIQIGNSTGALDTRAPIHVILDIVGYYGAPATADGGSQFHAMVPSRVVDTRPSQPQPPANASVVGAVAPEGSIDPVMCGPDTAVPGTAVAVIVNTVATQPTMFGWLTVYPGDETLPEASNLLFPAGGTVPNLVFAKVDPVDCKVFITNSKSPSNPNPNAGTVHVVVDHMGWFEP